MTNGEVKGHRASYSSFVIRQPLALPLQRGSKGVEILRNRSWSPVFALESNRNLRMYRHPKSFQWLAATAVVLTSLAAAAAVKPNPYEKIPVRNVFQLLPIPDKPIGEPPPPPRRPPPKIFITGLVQLRGVSKALIEISEPGQPVQRSILAAGGAAGVLEVLNVDVAAERVRVRIDGEEDTLSIQKPKPAAATPALNTPPVPPPPMFTPRPRVALRG